MQQSFSTARVHLRVKRIEERTIVLKCSRNLKHNEATIVIVHRNDPVVVAREYTALVVSPIRRIQPFAFDRLLPIRDHGLQSSLGLFITSPAGLIDQYEQFVGEVAVETSRHLFR